MSADRQDYRQDYQRREFAYRKSPDQDAPTPVRHPVVVVGAGPIGLAIAIDLASQQVPVVLVDDDFRLSSGSRAICFSKRTLEIFDRLECAEPMMAKGVSWNVGRIFFRDSEVFSFNLLPEPGHERPAFINLQQYYVEGMLQERAARTPGLEMRWKTRVEGLTQQADGVHLTLDTPDGPYAMLADYVVAADGAHSTLRKLLLQESKGQVFQDRFLIADVRMTADFPTERWFWFDPPFHPNQSVLLHRQSDNVWRIDFQLGWDADPVAEKAPERVLPRVRALLGEDAQFELEWVSVYTFSCRRMEHFRHGRVFFAGDAAHLVSPFGARGANSGVQDADNLAWKLARVLKGQSPDALLDSYGGEREPAADENILHSTRATDFITPKSAISRIFRDAVLTLARSHPFARQLVNSGRLSTPALYRDSPLNTPDRDRFDAGLAPGTPCCDAPLVLDGEPGWLLRQLGRHPGHFYLVLFGSESGVPARWPAMLERLKRAPLHVLLVLPPAAPAVALAGVDLVRDEQGLLASRFDARPGTAYLLRPDQHVCARWRELDPELVAHALARACALTETEAA